MMPNQAMIENEEVVATTIEVEAEAEKVSEEEVMVIILIKEEAIILDHEVKEEEEATTTKKEPISIASTVESMDTELQIAYSNP